MTNPSMKSAADASNDEWNQAAERAKEAAACVEDMATHVASSASTMASQAGRTADDLTARAGAGMQTFAERLAKQGPQQGPLGSASHSAAQALQDGGEYMESAKFSGMAEDFANMVRQNPLPAILIAVGLGWFIGRKI